MTELAAADGVNAAPFTIPLSSYEVLSGQPEIACSPGEPLAIRIREGAKVQMVFAEFAVEPDTIYRIDMRMRRLPRVDLGFRVQELKDGKVLAEHGLAFRPGYAPIPAGWDDGESYFATTADADRARLSLDLGIGPHLSSKIGGVSIEAARIVKTGKVKYHAGDSANFVLDPDLTKTDEQGVATGFSRWGGPHNANVLAGAGPAGGNSLEIKEPYLLTCADIAAVPGCRYRISAEFKGAGTVGFELRGNTSGNSPLFTGTVSPRYELSPDAWRRFGHETVALPGQARFAAVISLAPAPNATILVGKVEVVQVGRGP
jgi:hypothetical protein